jgi:hypothetical protein
MGAANAVGPARITAKTLTFGATDPPAPPEFESLTPKMTAAMAVKAVWSSRQFGDLAVDLVSIREQLSLTRITRSGMLRCDNV